MTIPMLILAAGVIAGPAHAGGRPFWTEKSSFTEGDRVYFVGVATGKDSVEAARKAAAEHAHQELANYLQIGSTRGLTFQTQMTFEENAPEGGFTVYRLMYVMQDALTAHQEAKLAEEAEAQEKRSRALDAVIKKKEVIIRKAERQEQSIKDLNSRLAQIHGRISELDTAVMDRVRPGMTTAEVREVMGRPRGTESCMGMRYDNYGSTWVLFIGGVVKCSMDTRRFRVCASC